MVKKFCTIIIKNWFLLILNEKELSKPWKKEQEKGEKKNNVKTRTKKVCCSFFLWLSFGKEESKTKKAGKQIEKK